MFSATLFDSFDCVFHIKILCVQFNKVSIICLTIDPSYLQLFVASFGIDIISYETTMNKKRMILVGIMEANAMTQGEVL